MILSFVFSLLVAAHAAPAKTVVCYGLRHPECAVLNGNELRWESNYGIKSVKLKKTEIASFTKLFDNAQKIASQKTVKNRKPALYTCKFTALVRKGQKYSRVCKQNEKDFAPFARLKGKVLARTTR